MTEILNELEKAHNRIVVLEDELNKINRINKSLRMNELKYKLIFENLHDVYYELDHNGIIREVSPSVEKLTLYKRDELIGKPVKEVYADKDKREKVIESIMQAGYVNDFEITIRDRDGRRIICSVTAGVVTAEEGTSRIAGIVRDITQRKQSEITAQKAFVEMEETVEDRTEELLTMNKQLKKEMEERRHAEKILQQSEDRYRNFMESAPIGLCIVDLEGGIQYVNRKIEEESGWRRDELIGKNGFAVGFFDDETLQLLMERLDARLKGAPPMILNIPVFCKNGKKLWVEVMTTILMEDNRPAGVQLVFVDNTDRVNAVKALIDSEKRYRAIFENVVSGMAILDEDTTISVANAEFVKITGYSRLEMEGKKSWTEIVARDDVDKMKGYHRIRRIDHNLPPRSYEFRLIDKDGQTKNVYLGISMIPGTKKSIASIVDVTELRKTEEALRKSEEKLRLVTDNMVDLVFQTDSKATLLYLTPSVERLTGYNEVDYLRESVFNFVHPDDMEISEFAFKEVLRTGYGTLEVRVRHQDGHYIWMELVGKALPASNENKAAVIQVGCRDITQRKRIETALKKREKELKSKSVRLTETNTALKVLLKNRETEKAEQEEKILTNIKKLVLPYVNKLKNSRLSPSQSANVEIVERNLDTIISPFLHKLTSSYMNLTHREIQLAQLIKDGKTTKEISKMLNISTRTIDSHRDRIRKKLGMSDRRTNLRSYLSSLA